MTKCLNFEKSKKINEANLKTSWRVRIKCVNGMVRPVFVECEIKWWFSELTMLTVSPHLRPNHHGINCSISILRQRLDSARNWGIYYAQNQSNCNINQHWQCLTSAVLSVPYLVISTSLFNPPEKKLYMFGLFLSFNVKCHLGYLYFFTVNIFCRSSRAIIFHLQVV